MRLAAPRAAAGPRAVGPRSGRRRALRAAQRRHAARPPAAPRGRARRDRRGRPRPPGRRCLPRRDRAPLRAPLDQPRPRDDPPPSPEGRLSALLRIGALRPLRHRDFALMWAGLATSLLGDGVYLVAIAWEAYELSNTPAAL